MATIQYNRDNPAISRFMASQATDDTQRRQETAEFDKRFQQDQARGVDKALRGGIGAMYATPTAAPAPATAAPTVVAEPAAPASSDVQVTSLPDPVQPQSAPLPSPGAAAAPAPAPAPQMPPAAMMIDQPQAAMPMGAQAPTTPAAPVAPTAPAIAAMTASQPPGATPAPPAAPGGRYAPLMQSLAETPGGGATMLAVHKAAGDEAAKAGLLKARKDAADIQLVKALHNADWNVAEAIARQFNINMPPEVIKNGRFRQEMTDLSKNLKAIGINDDVMAVQATKQYLDARSQGADQQQAYQQAVTGLKAPAGKGAKMQWDSTRGAWVSSPNDDNPNGRAVVPDNLPGRATGAGAGGAGSKQREFAEWRISTLTAAGVPLQKAQQIVAGRGSQVGPKDVATLARNLMHDDAASGQRNYKNLGEAMDAAKKALSGDVPAPAPAAPAAAPAATAAPAARTPPPVNAKGWKLHRDASGNMAYVGPNREIEEVR